MGGSASDLTRSAMVVDCVRCLWLYRDLTAVALLSKARKGPMISLLVILFYNANTRVERSCRGTDLKGSG